MWWTGQIDPAEWAAHFFAGVIASGCVVFWDKEIRHWFHDQSEKSKTSGVETTALKSNYMGDDPAFESVNWDVAPIRPKTRPGTAPAKRPEHPDCALSISFATPGIYF
jgi:hypothetical protein